MASSNSLPAQHRKSNTYFLGSPSRGGHFFFNAFMLIVILVLNSISMALDWHRMPSGFHLWIVFGYLFVVLAIWRSSQVYLKIRKLFTDNKFAAIPSDSPAFDLLASAESSVSTCLGLVLIVMLMLRAMVSASLHP
jgi:hypothetical protein